MPFLCKSYTDPSKCYAKPMQILRFETKNGAVFVDERSYLRFLFDGQNIEGAALGAEGS